MPFVPRPRPLTDSFQPKGARPMRCEEVAQEISAPTGRLDRSAMADHLAACPRCAAWSAQAARLDRIWSATRPADPPAFAFEQVWSNVVRSLETGYEPDFALTPVRDEPTPSMRTRRWRLAVAMLAPLAAAAAVVLAFGGLPGFRPTPAGPGPQPPSPEVVLASFDLEPGQTSIIHLNGCSGD